MYQSVLAHIDPVAFCCNSLNVPHPLKATGKANQRMILLSQQSLQPFCLPSIRGIISKTLTIKLVRIMD